MLVSLDITSFLNDDLMQVYLGETEIEGAGREERLEVGF